MNSTVIAFSRFQRVRGRGGAETHEAEGLLHSRGTTVHTSPRTWSEVLSGHLTAGQPDYQLVSSRFSEKHCSKR